MKKRSKFAALLALLVLLSGSLGACSPFQVGELAGQEDTQQDLVTVGFSQLGSESAWRTANTKSVQDALTTENGFFLLYDNARQLQDQQIKDLRSFISQRVDAIVFCPVEEEGWETVLGEANEAGVPVIALDRNIATKDQSLLTAFLGEDMRTEGVNAGLWLEKTLQEEGRQDEDIEIAVLQGTEGSSAAEGRSEGFLAIASRNQNWHFAAQADAEFTRAKGREVMKRFLSEFDDIDVVVAQNDEMALGALEAIESAGRLYGVNGKKLILISFDGTREALEAVQHGEIDLDVECNPLSGPALRELIENILSGKSYEKVNYLPEQVFTRENVDEYLDSRAY
ncbi:MAG: ABC transporter substrate-binding protein [Lachnospiraceae bacterium]